MLAEVRARRGGQAAPATPPSAWARLAACHGQSTLFDDPSQTADALAICATCPVLSECYSWALHNAVDGVAGGMTHAARQAWRVANNIAEPLVSAEDFLPTDVVVADQGRWLARSDTIIEAVGKWTEDGETARAIGDRLGVTRRSVNRYRAVCRARSLIA
jgi:AcrR family transcriptional regulator